MYSEEDFNQAVEQGILQRSDVQRFKQFIASGRNSNLVDEEHFRFVTGFNDIFVVIACCLVLGCGAILAGNHSELLGALVTMGTSWGLAEYFTRVKKMSLPSILLVVTFIFSSVIFFVQVLKPIDNDSLSVIGGGIFGAGMAYLHWRRFKVPITLACVVASFVYSLILSLALEKSISEEVVAWVSLVIGLCVLGLAVHWDMSDTERATKRSDVAFWLHLAAAPMIVHPIFLLLNVFDAEVSILNSLLVLGIYILLAFFSITLDRRALMVSSLFYVLYVYTNLFEEYGFVSSAFAVTGVIVGSALLILSAFWIKTRQHIMNLYPEGLRERLPGN